MYTDPITPRAYPDLLQKSDYDPWHVMPLEFPPHPRMVTTAAKLSRCAARIKREDSPTLAAWRHLREKCDLQKPPPAFPDKPDAQFANNTAQMALRLALADRLEPSTSFRDRAMDYLRLALRAFAQLELGGFEMELAWNISAAYDLLAAGGLSDEDEGRFKEFFNRLLPGLDRNPHRHCNNQSSFHMLGRLAAGAALGDRQAVHDALYGYERGGKWRYGLMHLLRHDFLADGMHWEGAMGYHMLVMLTATEMLTIMEHLGIDLWHRRLPPLTHDDGFDEHRGYGPKGTKCFKAAFDAFFYQAFPNGDYSLLHDQVLGNIRGAYAWLSLFNKAFEVYGDPKYAWLLNRMRAACPETADNPQPVWFRNSRGDIEFARLASLVYPPGRFSFANDVKLGQSGRHVNGCSLFPVHGTAILRALPESEDGPAAYLYFGPHWAGHRGPAALHLDLHVGGRRLTAAPHVFQNGYDDPRHLTWNRTTIAHNTVTVDQASMFPYDFPTRSLWECDLWRDRISDGRLEFFQPDGQGFKAIRAANDNVYENVLLDRTVVLTGEYAVDLYRVSSPKLHQYDWAMHCLGKLPPAPPESQPYDLGQNRGYCHFRNARQWPVKPGWRSLRMAAGAKSLGLHLLVSKNMQLVTADEPEVDARTPIADMERPPQRQAILLRARTAQAMFVAIWLFGEQSWTPVRISGGPAADVTLTLQNESGSLAKWRFPLAGQVKIC